MTRDVRQYVETCTTCQRIKPVRHKPYGHLQTLEAPQGPFTDLTMDFITGLPPSNKRPGSKAYDAILVVIDRYTKFARYIPMRKTITAPELAEVMINKVFLKGVGVPRMIVSDRRSVFTAKFWSVVCYQLRIRHRKSIAFHPQIDGQTERQNQTLEQYLRSTVNYQQDDWVMWLPMAEFAYNNSRHANTGETPFFLLYGRHPDLRDYPDPEQRDAEVPAAAERVKALQQMREDLQPRWDEARRTHAKYYDKKVQPRAYSIGDRVWLSGKNIWTIRLSKKLDHKFYGPFRIIDAHREQAYKLELKGTLRGIHDGPGSQPRDLPSCRETRLTRLGDDGGRRKRWCRCPLTPNGPPPRRPLGFTRS